MLILAVKLLAVKFYILVYSRECLSSNYFLTFFALVTPPEDCKTGNMKLTQNFDARKTSKSDKKCS